MIVSRCQHRINLTIFPIELILRKEGAADYRILSERQNCEGRGDDAYGSLESLYKQLYERDLILRCCGCCWYLQVTGLSRQMSSGEKGYCLLFVKEYGRSLNDVVSVFDYCDFFKFGPQGLVRNLEQAFRNRDEKH